MCDEYPLVNLYLKIVQTLLTSPMTNVVVQYVQVYKSSCINHIYGIMSQREDAISYGCPCNLGYPKIKITSTLAEHLQSRAMGHSIEEEIVTLYYINIETNL